MVGRNGNDKAMIMAKAKVQKEEETLIIYVLFFTYFFPGLGFGGRYIASSYSHIYMCLVR